MNNPKYNQGMQKPSRPLPELDQIEMNTAPNTPAEGKSRGLREAAIRAEELRTRMRNNTQAPDMYDEFYISPTIIPEGWDYNWKRKTVVGAEDKEHAIEMAQAGWEAVDASRHPEMMPAGYRGPIERKGMVLMERPSEISNMAKERELATARQAVRDKEQAIGISRPGQFEATQRKVSKSYGPINIPTS
jgi:hypothetical protein